MIWLKENEFHCAIIDFSNPTPDGVELLDGIPEFLPYSRSQEAYMDIDCDWTVKMDYTKTYTVTVDDLKSGHVPCRCFIEPDDECPASMRT